MSYDREKRKLRRKRNLIAKELQENRVFRPKVVTVKKKKILEEILKEELDG